MIYQKEEEASITRLRNMLSPVSNYFALIQLDEEQRNKLPKDYLKEAERQAIDYYNKSVILIKDDSKWV